MSQCVEKHLSPIHLNRKAGHVWICLECEKQIGGPKLREGELEDLIQVVLEMRERYKDKIKKMKTRDQRY